MKSVIGVMALPAILFSTAAVAVDITLTGLFPSKALVQIDGGPLQTLSVGQKTPQGVVLLAVESDAATFEIDGKPVRIEMGRGRTLAGSPTASTVQLTGDMRGHFFANGQVNGLPIRFLVDTGATLVVMSAGDADRLRIDYRKGRKARVNTANGKATMYRVKFDKVSVGDITVYDVEGAVAESEENSFEPLLGMSFLNRTDMKREGNVMTLTKRY